MPDNSPPPPGTALVRRERTGVALYVCEPDPVAARQILAAARQIATEKGWEVAAKASVIDHCLLTSDPQSRAGWTAVRQFVRRPEINVLLVPEIAHLGWRWSVWQAEQRHLHTHGVSLASVAPMLDTILQGGER
ncbi:hypothetical protein ACIRQY_34000 [Streptomyces sp. NPDC101490]|uniref:hypothetical protein n=1 Tax=Streptomyces sp. NPDC101490 TaxID=3366143 RepID=UPI003802412C